MAETGRATEINLRPIREPEPAPKAADVKTIEAIMRVASQVGEDWERARNLALVMVLRDSGARVGAVVRIRVSMLDLDRRMTYTPDKGTNCRPMFFSPATVAQIRAWLEVRPQLEPQDDYLFTGRRGTGIVRNTVGQVLNRLAAAADVDGRHNAHAWRHAFARDVIYAGADINDASQLLGHTSIAITARYYARWDTARLKSLHRRFSPLRDE